MRESVESDVEVAREVFGRFGLLPNFFRYANVPDPTGDLWRFAQAAYLDNPLPPLFKERLFVQLSRFCEARYCVVRHVGFLMGQRWVAGDPSARSETVADVVALFARPFPDDAEIAAVIERMRGAGPLATLPSSGTQLESDTFDTLTAIFVDPARSLRAQGTIRRLYGDATFERLMVFLAFVRTAHFWTSTHAGITYEPDMLATLERYPELRALLDDRTEARRMRALVRARGAFEASNARELVLGETQSHLDSALLAGRMAVWRWDASTDELTPSDRLFELLGIDGAATASTLRATDFLHADDIARDRVALGTTVTPTTVRDEIRIMRPVDGRALWLERHARVIPRSETDGGSISGIVIDITERKTGECEAREREARREFLLRLADAVRPIDEATELASLTCRMLAEHVGADRAFVANADSSRPSFVARSIDDRTRPKPTVVDDTSTSPLLTAAARASYERTRVRAFVSAPLGPRRCGQTLTVASSAPRIWTRSEAELVANVAERMGDDLERAIARQSLRERADRDTFLLELEKRLRSLVSADAMRRALCESAARVLGARSVAWIEDTAAAQEALVRAEHPESSNRRWDDEAFAPIRALLRREGAYFASSLHAAVDLDAATRERLGALGIAMLAGAYVASGDTNFYGILAHGETSQGWNGHTIALLRAGLERTSIEIARAEAAESVRRSEEQSRRIVEIARDYAIVTLDDEGTIASWSSGAEAIYGWRALDVVGLPFETIFSPSDRSDGVPARELEAARTRDRVPDVRWHVRDDGAAVCVDATTWAVRDDDRTVRGFVTIGKDVSDDRRMRDELARSEARFRNLIDGVRDHAILMLDAAGTITDMTAGASAVTGFERDEALGRDVSLLYLHEAIERGSVAAELTEAAAMGRAERDEWRVRRNGERFWANVVTTALYGDDGALCGYTSIVRDATARYFSERALERRRYADRRDALRRRLAMAEEEERRRLSRELHDEAGQHLTTLSLGLQSLCDRLEAGSEAHAATGKLQSLTDRLGRELHALAVRLRPKVLDDFGLEAAVTAYGADWSQRACISIDLHVSISDLRLEPDVESAIYRIVQEALTNVARHSGARAAGVAIERVYGYVHVLVEDDGRGFIVQPDFDSGSGTGLGLLGIRERVGMLGGTLELESDPDRGTTLFVRLPIDSSGAATSGDGDDP